MIDDSDQGRDKGLSKKPSFVLWAAARLPWPVRPHVAVNI